MSQFEIDLVKKLSTRSAEPRPEFSEKLRGRLVSRERELKADLKPIRRHQMIVKKLSLGLGLVILAGAAAFILTRSENPPRQTAQPQNPSTTQSSSLPNEQVQDLEAAKRSLTFVPILPNSQLNGESLASIKVGTKNNMLDDSDTIYLSYSDNLGTLYKMSQSRKQLNYPTDAEKVTININGTPVIANYYRLAEEGGGEISSVGNDPSSPTSYIFWTMDGINYEISEFGRVNKQQLINLASSLK